VRHPAKFIQRLLGEQSVRSSGSFEERRRFYMSGPTLIG
jgi:hypothetical protein